MKSGTNDKMRQPRLFCSFNHIRQDQSSTDFLLPDWRKSYYDTGDIYVSRKYF